MKKETPAPRSNFKKEKTCGLLDRFIEESIHLGELPLKRFMTYIEVSLIVSSLKKSKANRKEAAKTLGVKYTTLNEKMKRYRIGFHKIPCFHGKNGN